MNDHQYTNVLLEEIRGKVTTLGEGMMHLQELPKKFEKFDQRLTRVESDVHSIKLAVGGHSYTLTDQNHV